MVAAFANGDARVALSTLEMVVLNGERRDGKVTVTSGTVEQCISKKSLLYDKNGEEHYNIISALHKSMRNSDPDAAVYWLSRMLEAGEDPLVDIVSRMYPEVEDLKREGARTDDGGPSSSPHARSFKRWL